MGREVEKPIKSAHLEKINVVDERQFVSPVVITVKSDPSVNLTLDSRKLYDSSIQTRPQMSYMEELSKRILVEITGDRNCSSQR